MMRSADQFDVARPLLRGICLVVKGQEPGNNRRQPVSIAARGLAEFPRRPDPRVLSESIPLFFIGRNKHGLWVAREAEGRTGGIFLFKRSALRFAAKNSAPAGCATMLLSERFELDVENRGNPLIVWFNTAMRVASRRRPPHTAAHTAAAAMGGNQAKGENS